MFMMVNGACRAVVLALIVVVSFLGCCDVQAGEYPERIVSLGPINTENVFLLGAGDRLVGNTSYCVRPEVAKTRPQVGSVMQVSVEKILALKPDLVLATGLTQESQIKALERVGLTVVRFDQPRSFEQSCEHLEELGRLLGLGREATSITSSLRGRVNVISERIKRSGVTGPRVLLQIGANPLYVSGIDSFTHDFIKLLKAENVMGDEPSGRIGYEQVIAADPEIILIGIMGSEGGVAAQEKEKWQKFGILPAVKTNRIHIVDPDLVCSPSPETFVEALEHIEHLFYPELAGADGGAS